MPHLPGTQTPDVIDVLAGIRPGDRLDLLRARRPEAREHAQGAYLALFEPDDTSAVSLVERRALALFVAALHRSGPGVSFYGDALRADEAGAHLADIVLAEAELGAHPGPYGRFLFDNADESVAGPEHEMSGVETVYVLGERLVAAIEHAHMLTLHPRDASRAHLQKLLDAGWSTTGIVTISQLVSFLAFQLRVAHGLIVLRGKDAS
ncbi:CMD domain protein [Microbacterium sp. LRZ72]|uniref:CMD domain protein n=1 Tax=Microbacterium sp. LRZ72 TaxID=2942481 RepID=UPI0029AF75DB|nr:CMD domain protein [Microbacterium sp. LRZ72]MDX2375243.1 CMD domain protein [Microbacterium sp. LRZ72]